MADLERITIAMPAEMAAMLRATVERGEYASTSEIIREALRDWNRKQENYERDLAELREAIRVGDESGPGIPMDEAFAEIYRRLKQNH
ncbi:MAG: type II toxin-antitoxin system ParD family antitoxin [Rickettsiales bacterium]